MATHKKFEDLDITKDELQRISEALKKEEFRKLLVEYAEEISDPVNKARYEAEIRQMEGEKGMDVTFIHPSPGYVIKTIADGENKVFINICQNDKLDKPAANREKNLNGKFGLNWRVPHSFAPPRDDHDKNKIKCKVYDVVFHPDTLRMAESNQSFTNMVNNIALDGIEMQFGTKLDKKNLRFPKIKFKGNAQATVVRKKKEDAPESKPVDPDDPLGQFPYPYDDLTTEEKSKQHLAAMEKKKQEQEAKEKKTIKNKVIKDNDNGTTMPKYSILYRSDMDMLNYTNARDSSPGTRPTEIVVAVELPLMKSSRNVNLDIYEKRLILSSETPAKYSLDLDLPYPVSEEQGSAKFDKSKRTLTITLPVIKEKVQTRLDEADRTNVTAGDDEGECKPMIEVLGDGDGDGDNNRTCNVTPAEKTLTPPPNVEVPYNLPSYDYHQDEETVTFILHVKNVDEGSTEQNFFPLSNEAYKIRFASVGSGGYPVHYSFFAGFREGCSVVSDKCKVDVSEQNVVCVLTKTIPVLWHKFSVQLNEGKEGTTEEKEFLTQSNLDEDLQRLDAAECSVGEKAPNLEVTEFDEEGITISITPGYEEQTVSDKTVDQGASAAGEKPVEIVHDKVPPKLHSILKQKNRTVSESSDDLGNSINAENSLGYSSNSNGLAGSDCTISESDESGETKLRKSVSFSSRVDTTTFKNNMSVSAMKGTLKSKRRRQRKKEQREQNKQERRRRHNSTGSEYSSSEESHTLRKECVSHSNDANDDKTESTANTVQTPADVASLVAAEERTTENTLPREDIERTCDDKNISPDELSSTATVTSPLGKKLREETQAAVSKILNDSAENGELNSDDEEDHLTNGDSKPQIETVPQTAKTKESSLNWGDKPVEMDNLNHKTQCAFEFENNLMYDLDCN